MTILALELFCGIGGFAAAVAGRNVHVVAALDQSREALAVYRLNYPSHRAVQADLERVTEEDLAAYRADFWWLSPPCQPYSVRGTRRDLADPRARSLVNIMERFSRIPPNLLPTHLAMENVEGFSRSEARARLLDLLAGRGYRLLEFLLCPTELGVPSRRPRYYLAASRTALHEHCASPPTNMKSLGEYVDATYSRNIPEELLVPAGVLEKFGEGLRILDSSAPRSYTTCFTSGYGKSIMHAGSYLREGTAVRRFSPEEIARLLHFPAGFSFPREMPRRTRWRLVGNSLSVIAVREVLAAFPAIHADPAHYVGGPNPAGPFS
jgi:site-specific DNA-cytosine methylase